MRRLFLSILLAALVLSLTAVAGTEPAGADHCSTVWTHNAYHQHTGGFHTGYHQYQTCHGYHFNIIHTH